MIDLIDRDKLLNSMFADDPKDFFVYIADFPYVDAVEVVRCKDCKWYDGAECCERNGIFVGFVADKFFCYDGDRKEINSR